MFSRALLRCLLLIGSVATLSPSSALAADAPRSSQSTLITTPADLIVVNARVLTVDAANSRASAVAIKDGRFVAVGSDVDIRKLAGPQTRTLDARQRSVIPGL